MRAEAQRSVDGRFTSVRWLLSNRAQTAFENQFANTFGIFDRHCRAVNRNNLEYARGAHDDNQVADLQHGPSLGCDPSESFPIEQSLEPSSRVESLSARKACGSVRAMHSELPTVPSTYDDIRLMGMALAAARLGAAADEVPIGAVLARDGVILSVAHNAPIRLHDPTAHAEILALRGAAQTERDYRLPGTTLYVTAEPCVMCVGALIHARVRHVVFGCREPKSGALTCWSAVGSNVPSNHRFTFSEGVCADEARTLLQEFFRARRGA